MILFFSVIFCSVIDIDSVRTLDVLYEETVLFKAVKTILDQKNEFINRTFLEELFMDEEESERKINFIFESLNRAYNIVMDRDFLPLRDLMIGLYTPNEDLCLNDYKTSILSMLITRLTELSCFDKLYRDVKYNLFTFEDVLDFSANLNYKICSDIMKKISEKILEKNKLICKKMSEKGKFIDKVLYIEILAISVLYDDLSASLSKMELHTIYQKCPIMYFIWNEFNFNDFVEDDAYLLLDRKTISIMKISTSILSSVFKSYEGEELTKITSNISVSYKSSVTSSEKLLQKHLNKVINLEKEYLDMFLCKVYYFCGILQEEVLVKITTHQDHKVSIEIINIGSIYPLDFILKLLKKECDSTKQMEKLIAGNIKNDKVHTFTTASDLTTYDFAKPSVDSVPIRAKCLRLSCGHFVGQELLKEYIYDLKFKCHMCNRQTTVSNYFETNIYEVPS